jgi:hypothetical protein
MCTAFFANTVTISHPLPPPQKYMKFVAIQTCNRVSVYRIPPRMELPWPCKPDTDMWVHRWLHDSTYSVIMKQSVCNGTVGAWHYDLHDLLHSCHYVLWYSAYVQQKFYRVETEQLQVCIKQSCYDICSRNKKYFPLVHWSPVTEVGGTCRQRTHISNYLLQ